MSTLDLLQQRAAERDALLERAARLLSDDDRVVAVWLHGSLGRGTGDALSDIDLWVVVQDDYINEVRKTRQNYVVALGTPLLFVEAPQNAPTNGAFLTVLYEGQVAGPQHVDWTWQANADAIMPSDAKELLKRNRAPEKAEISVDLLDPEVRAKSTANQIAFIWMMIPVVAKYILREQTGEVVSLLAFVRSSIDEVKWLTDKHDAPPEYPTSGDAPPPIRPIEQLTFLRELAGEAEKLVGNTDKDDKPVTSQARKQIYQFLDLASNTIEERD